MLNATAYTPSVDNQSTNNDKVRVLIMECFMKPSLDSRQNSEVCNEIASHFPIEGKSEAFKAVIDMIGDGIANLRDVVRYYYDLQNIQPAETVKHLCATAKSHFNLRINSEISRIMTLVIAASSPESLAEDPEVYLRMTDSMLAIQNDLFKQMQGVVADLRGAGSK